MRAADTNLLVRLIVRDDATQFAAAKEFLKAGAWVSLLALAEMVWVLKNIYSLKSAEQVDAIATTLGHAGLVIQDAEIAEAALARFRNSPALGFSDCLLLEIARKAGHLPLGTFDKRLGKETGAEVVG